MMFIETPKNQFAIPHQVTGSLLLSKEISDPDPGVLHEVGCKLNLGEIEYVCFECRSRLFR